MNNEFERETRSTLCNLSNLYTHYTYVDICMYSLCVYNDNELYIMMKIYRLWLIVHSVHQNGGCTDHCGLVAHCSRDRHNERGGGGRRERERTISAKVHSSEQHNAQKLQANGNIYEMHSPVEYGRTKNRRFKVNFVCSLLDIVDALSLITE